MTASSSQHRRPNPIISSGLIAPTRGIEPHLSWEGILHRKPWEYRVTAVIPVLDTIEPLETCIEILRAQSERPYILVIDTGSIEQRQQIEALAAEDLEVHQLRSHAWRHASEPVAVACQLGQELCKTEFIFQTHADCLLMKRTLLAEWCDLAALHKVVGYQITKRPYEGWETEIGHTALMMHRPSIRGLTWNMSDFCARHGRELGRIADNLPDTESGMNACLRDMGIFPLMLGGEENYKRNTNDDFDHPRSFCCSKLYASNYHEQMALQMADAIGQARQRAAEWRLINGRDS